MIQNYFKVSLRNLWRNRTSSAVSIFGLSVGLAGGLVIFMLVSYLFSFNRYHSKADRIYWIVTDILQENVQQTDVTPRPLGDVLRREYPFVESAVRLNNLFGSIVSIPDGHGGSSKKFEESRNICFTEPQFFDVFDSKWIYGNPKNALSSPNAVVLSKDYALKYFGKENAVGSILRFNHQTDLTVTGIIENQPSNTQLRYDVMISYSTQAVLSGEKDMMNIWDRPSTMCWVALGRGTDVSQLEKSLSAIEKKYYPAKEAPRYHFRTIPLSEMFHTPGYGPAPRPVLYALIVVGIFLVIAACVNFINLATAQAIKRSREVGVRKTLGSTRRQLVVQFMTETALLCLSAFVIAIVLTQLNLPLLNNALWMLRANMSVLDLLNPNALLWFGGLIAGVVILAGLYPATVLARFNPIAALKGKLTIPKAGRISARKGLVVIQFFIAQLFIIGVIVMSAQVRYLKTADLGFSRDAVFMVPVPSDNAVKQQTLREELTSIHGVEQVALASEAPFSRTRQGEPFTFNNHPEPEKFPVRVKMGDMNFTKLFGLKILAGRNFRSNDSTANEVLVNETMLRQLGITTFGEVLGKNFKVFGSDRTVVGVVRDFNLDELSMGIQPAAIINFHPENNIATIKINPANVSKTLGAIEKSWNELFPDAVYKGTFLDDQINEIYATENILLGLIQAFSVIAVMISCLGLYGLVTFMSESRSKEIGVRKALGATKKQLLWIFGREFTVLLLAGFVLAAPLGWFAMKSWLQGYVYRIEPGWWVFALTVLLVAVITFLTVSFQAMKAAAMNPVTSLKNE